MFIFCLFNFPLNKFGLPIAAGLWWPNNSFNFRFFKVYFPKVTRLW